MTSEEALSTPIGSYDDVRGAIGAFFEDCFDYAGGITADLSTLVVGKKDDASPLHGTMSINLSRLLEPNVAEDDAAIEHDTSMAFSYGGTLLPFSYNMDTTLSFTSGVIEHRITLEDMAWLEGLTLEAGAQLFTKGCAADDAMTFGASFAKAWEVIHTRMTVSLTKSHNTTWRPNVSLLTAFGGDDGRVFAGLTAEGEEMQAFEQVSFMAGFANESTQCQIATTLGADSEAERVVEVAGTHQLSETMSAGMNVVKTMNTDAPDTSMAYVLQLQNDAIGLLCKGSVRYSLMDGAGLHTYVQQRVWGGVTLGFGLSRTHATRYGLYVSNNDDD
eukprot:PhM_4_TR5607/c0_g1_i1/m.58723